MSSGGSQEVKNNANYTCKIVIQKSGFARLREVPNKRLRLEKSHDIG